MYDELLKVKKQLTETLKEVNAILEQSYGENVTFQKVKSYLSDKEEVSAAEIWAECLGKDLRDFNKHSSKEVNNILNSSPGWELSGRSKRFEKYGKQRYFIKISAF